MKWFNLIALLCTILLFCSCKNEKNQVSTDFPETKELEILTMMGLDSIHARYPRMRIDGGYCCIADFDAYDCFFYLYTFPELKYLKSFGRKGHAQSELTMLTDFDFKNGVVSALCGADRVIKLYNAISTQDEVSVIHYDKTMDYSAISDNGNGCLYTYAMEGKNRIMMFDYQGNLLARRLPLPSAIEDDMGFNANYLYQSVIYSTPEYFVSATIAGERIEIMENGTNSAKVIMGNLGAPTMYEITFNGMTAQALRYTTYVDLFVHDNIYGLYMGDDSRNKENNEHSIRMFALNGASMRKYMIPNGIEPNSIYVDEDHDEMYLLVPDSEKPVWKCKM